jgi:RNA polymerase sigma-70 factor (ECF subfamily)
VPASNSSEEALVYRAQSGDADALVELYQRHAPAIFRYFLFRVSERASAEDLTGEVFERMVAALPRYEQRGLPFAAWLFRIAHDRWVDHQRRAQHRQTEPLSEWLETDAPGTEAQALAHAAHAELWAQLAALTDEQRQVIQLRFVEGYNLEECAQLLGKTTGAVKALQHRALQQLARKLAP